jgi:predicted amidohydrolase
MPIEGRAPNARAHASLIRSARARLIVFPELLSLTGYELDAEPVSPDAQALMSIVEACAEANSVALVDAWREEMPVGQGTRADHGPVRIMAPCGSWPHHPGQSIHRHTSPSRTSW